MAALPTILVADDEDILLDLARTILSRNGFNVITASNGEDALKLFGTAESGVDLLLTDVVMPKMTGPELARRLCDLNPILPVIFTSGYTSDMMESFGLTVGQANFLEKPYTLGHLVEKVREVLSRSRPPGAR